jgi:hypothetical protein
VSWYAVYDVASGRLVSQGSVAPDNDLPEGQRTKVFEVAPTQNTQWEDGSLTFTARPAKVLVDRLGDLLTGSAYADFQEAYALLLPSHQQKVQDALVRLLGKERFRNPSEGVTLG